MKTGKIEDIRKKFKNEWLLFKVEKVENSHPFKGQLLAHSPDRTYIYKEIHKYTSKYPVFVTYYRDNLPKGYAAAFCFNYA